MFNSKLKGAFSTKSGAEKLNYGNICQLFSSFRTYGHTLKSAKNYPVYFQGQQLDDQLLRPWTKLQPSIQRSISASRLAEQATSFEDIQWPLIARSGPQIWQTKR